MTAESRGEAQIAKGTGQGRSQGPKQRKQARTRRGMIPMLIVLGIVAFAATMGLVLARNSGTKSVSIGPSGPLALPGQTSGESSNAAGRAPDFAVQTLSGDTFALRPLKGPVVISFIAGWCASCLEEATAGGKVLETFKGSNVRVLAVDADPSDSLTQLNRFREAAGNPPVDWYMDRDSTLTRSYRVRALDTTFVIDRNGNIVYSDERPTDYETMAAAVEKALG